jgi:Domain of unknown function (DUF6457)
VDVPIGTIPMDDWLLRLEAAVTGSPKVRTITTLERRRLLEIARIAAHTSERVAAPISTYLLGLALAGLSAADRGRELNRIRTALALFEVADD